MGIGSFLAGAGQIGATAEEFVNKREVQRAARAEAQARQLELARTEKLRQGVIAMPDLSAEGPMYNLGAPGAVEDVGARRPAGITPVGTGTGTGAAPPVSAKPPVTSAPQKRMFAGVEVPYYDKNAPERLGVDPNASDVSKFFLRGSAMNDVKNRMNRIVTKVSEPFGDFRRPFMKQDRKAESDVNQRVAQWMQSDNARNYFARNPEMLDVAEKDPTGFFKALMNDPRPKKTAAPKAAATKAAAKTPVANALETNPGALRDGPYARRQPGYAGVSGGFAVFETPAQGIAAQQNLLRSSYLDKGFNTVNKIIDKYTPAADKGNSPEARRNYKAYIAGRLGIGLDTPIGEDQLLAFGQAQREFETGNTVRGGAAPGGVQQGAAQVASAAQDRIDPSNFYLSNPTAISRDTSNAIQARQELTQMANLYRQSGMVGEFTQARAALREADNNIRMLQGMQGITEMAVANDPRRLAAVWSDYAGTPIQIQPRTDGTFNIVVNGKVAQQGVDRSSLVDTARSTFDRAYLQQRVETQSAINLERIKGQLRVDEATATAVLNAAKDIQVAQINGQAGVARQLALNLQSRISQSPDGRAWLMSGGTIQQLIPDYVPPGAPEGVAPGPAALPIAGLTQRTVSVGTGG